jgi:hypothetical protein
VTLTWNGVNHPIASGPLLGLASPPLPLAHGPNTCQIAVTPRPGLTTTYSITIDRPFLVLQHSCGPVSIDVTGSARLGAAVSTSLTGQGAGLPFIGLGFPPGLPFCTCTVGHSWSSANFGSQHVLVVPNNPSFLGIQVGIQGAGLGTSGGCIAPSVSLSNTVIFTVGA